MRSKIREQLPGIINQTKLAASKGIVLSESGVDFRVHEHVFFPLRELFVRLIPRRGRERDRMQQALGWAGKANPNWLD